MKTSNNSMNYHLDKSVLLFFVLTILVTATVFSYKYINYTPCEIIDFSMDKAQARVNQSIKFEDNTVGSTTWEWSFGDNSETDSRRSPYHKYDKPGEYDISLVVNGKCPTTKTITILEKKEVLDPSKKAKFKILTKRVRVGEKMKLKDNTLNAKSWEWSFENSKGATSKKQNPEYVYTTPGKKTITLIVNAELKYATTQTIEVLPKKGERIRNPGPIVRPPITDVIPEDPIEEHPVEEDLEEFKAPFIGKDSFKAKLILVSKKKLTANDFKEYLCGNLDLSIVSGSKRTTFLEFCQKIRGKSIKIEELELIREDNNCIKNITLEWRKTSIF